MAYAVDFVLNVMKELSSDEPVMFQRDGSLFIASGQGFAQVTYGLQMFPDKIESWEERSQPPEIKESEDVIQRWRVDGTYKFPVLKKGEEPYIKAISLRSDESYFTLEDMIKGARELSELKDDGKIRMILHGRYSNRYNDLSVDVARVMDRKRYLEIIRDKEGKIIEQIESIGNAYRRRHGPDSYERLTFPDCVILTHYMIVSFPRFGKLDPDRIEPDSWAEGSMLLQKDIGSTKGSILDHERDNTSAQSPYGANITLNAQFFQAAYAKTFDDRCLGMSERISKELSAVRSNMDMAEEFAANINMIHNRVCADYIKRFKSV